MSKKHFKRLADYEFVQKVRWVVLNTPQDVNHQRFETSLLSNSNNMHDIGMSVLQVLTNDVSYARGATQKDLYLYNNTYQYYCLPDVEVFGIITDTKSLSQITINYVVIGEQGKSDIYYSRIKNIIASPT